MNNDIVDTLGASMTAFTATLAQRRPWTEGLTLTGESAKRFELAMRIAASTEVHFAVLESARDAHQKAGDSYAAACLDSIIELSQQFSRTFPPSERVA